MPRVKTTPLLPLLGLLLLGACSSIDRGVVVSKGNRFRPGATPPIDSYWVDVRGRNRDGARVTERLLLFERDWNRFDIGDRISPHDFDAVGAAQKLKASVQKLTRADGKPGRKRSGSDRGARRKSAQRPSTPETEAARFRNVEARAHDDAGMRELKRKVHAAKTDDEQVAAFQEYRRALFQRMRDLDPTLKEHIDAAESAR